MTLFSMPIRQQLIALASALVITGIAILYSAYTIVVPLVAEYHQFQAEGQKRHYFISRMRAELGYGGGIHAFKNYVLRGTEKYHQHAEQGFARVLHTIKRFETEIPITPEEQAALNNIAKVTRQYINVLMVARENIHKGLAPKEIDQLVKVDDTPAITAFGVLSTHYHRLSIEYSGHFNEQIESLFWRIALTMLAGGAIVSALFFTTGTSIRRKLRTIREAMREFAEHGKLNQRMEMEGSDDITQLADSFNEFIDKIRNIVNLIIDASSNLANEAQRMSDITSESQNTVTAQHREIEQIATAIREITQSQEKVAANAASAAESTLEANNNATLGRQEVDKAVTTSQEMNAETDRVGLVVDNLDKETAQIRDVLVVINDIADQTNLLALNAAIEAARAGEYGRGFAVVADEVRALSHRIQGETQQIQTRVNQLINGAGEAVTAINSSRDMATLNMNLNTHVGEAFEAIATAMSSIADLNRNIADSTNRESQRVTELERAVANLSNLAEQSSQSAIAASASGKEFRIMADQLQDMVRQFLLEDGHPDQPATPDKRSASAQHAAPATDDDVELF